MVKNDGALGERPQGRGTTGVTTTVFPDEIEGLQDFVRSGHIRPTAWLRFGRLCVKEMNIESIAHAKELAAYLMMVCELAESLTGKAPRDPS